MAAHSWGRACSLCILFLLLSCSATLSAALSTTQDSPLCTMPSPAPQELPAGKKDALPLLRTLELNGGYFFGGEGIHFTRDDTNASTYDTRSFSLLPLDIFRTTDPTLLHVGATLILSGGRVRRDPPGPHRRRRRPYTGRHTVTFYFHGYYSTTSAELCMTGSGSYSEDDGATERLLDVELHLRVPNPPNITNPFVTGRLRGAGFATIPLLAYAEGDADADAYQYAKTPASRSPPQPSSAATRSGLQALGASFSCARLKARLATSHKLQYGGGGGAHASGSSPPPVTGLQVRRMHVVHVQCAAGCGGVRVYAALSNDTTMWGEVRPRSGRPPVEPGDEVVVAEGSWDAEQRMLCLQGCRVEGLGTPSVAVDEGCGVGMSFWFPGVWTIRDRSSVAGALWNSSQVAAVRLNLDILYF